MTNVVIIPQEELTKIHLKLDELIQINKLRLLEPSVQLLTDVEFCELLKINKKTSSKLRKEQEITYIQKGKLIFYRLSEIDNFLKKYEVKKKE